MKKLIKYIPISLFIIASSYFDMCAPNAGIKIVDSSVINTNWSVFYFTVIYVAWLVHCVIEASSNDWFFFGAISGTIVLRIILELKKLGMDYESYLQSLSNLEQRIMLIVWICISLLSVIIYYGRNNTNLGIRG